MDINCNKVIDILKQIKQDYRLTLEAYRDAKAQGDKECMKIHSSELVRLADLMEAYS